MHPNCNALPHSLFKSQAEGAVAAEAAVFGKLLYDDGLFGSDSLAIELHKVIDAQIVDIGIVGDTLRREILAEISTVGTENMGELWKSDVVLQIELSGNTTLIEQFLDIGRNRHRLLFRLFEMFLRLLGLVFDFNVFQLRQRLNSPQQEAVKDYR